MAENNSKIGTGSGLDHSPSVHALYQPTEPELARRTSAIQLRIWTIAFAPGARKPMRRWLPSGSVASIPPLSNLRSISSSTRSKAGEMSRAKRPPPVAKRAVRAYQMLAARGHGGGVMNSDGALSSGMRNGELGRSAGLEEALVGQIGAAVLLVDHRHPRPEQEGADMLVSFRGGGEARVVEIERRDLRVQPGVIEAMERVVRPGPADTLAAPDHLALPEGQRDLAGLDHPWFGDSLDQRAG